MGLPYPGGPLIDKLAREGNPKAFEFSKPSVANLDYSFSGLKTSFLYFLRDHVRKDPDFVEQNKKDLCASLQQTIIDILMEKLVAASRQTGIKEIALAGGVSANSGLRKAFVDGKEKFGWNIYIPKFAYTTDNAAMIAITGLFKYRKQEFVGQDVAPFARMMI
jgi:N6-L-threonylcarbamoyladenine synthase